MSRLRPVVGRYVWQTTTFLFAVNRDGDDARGCVGCGSLPALSRTMVGPTYQKKQGGFGSRPAGLGQVSQTVAIAPTNPSATNVLVTSMGSLLGVNTARSAVVPLGTFVPLNIRRSCM